MELYEKILIRNEKEASDFINNWESNKVRNYLSVEDFKKYPALLCYGEDDNDYSMSYASQGYWSITYPDDFNEKVSDNSDVDKIYNFIKKDIENPYYDNGDCERIHGYQDILKFIEDNIYKDEK